MIRNPKDGFDMVILSPGETGLPFYVFIFEDMGVVPDVRVEVADSPKGSRSEMVASVRKVTSLSGLRIWASTARHPRRNPCGTPWNSFTTGGKAAKRN